MLAKPYSLGSYNKFDEKEQWIRITEGCPHHHEFCYEPIEIKVFPIPEIVRNKVKIMDMNLLCKSQALEIITELMLKKVNNKVIYYELICGIDFRFLDQGLAYALHNARFKNIRIAWDFGFEDQYKIKDAIKMLLNAHYKPNDITIFMICNWKISYETCMAKMDLCKVWNVKIADCYFDNQLSPNIKPVGWDPKQIKSFRKSVRKHNQLVNFKIDPEFISLT
jgi:hypothetical protein